MTARAVEPAGFPPLLRGLCDDAAVFPPGSAAVADAVPAHLRYRAARFADLVGPFVFPAVRIRELTGAPPMTVALTVHHTGAGLSAALAATKRLPGLTLAAVEFGSPAQPTTREWVADVVRRADSLPPGVTGFVELPMDDLLEPRLRELAGSRHAAKLRTGGVVAPAHPPVERLAAAILAIATAGVPFKATAGLHHAIRNTDSRTGFEQHGFLNVLLAIECAHRGGAVADLAHQLARRDGAAIAAELTALAPERVAAIRARFRSFGTCSIVDPLTDLVRLGLLPETCFTPASAAPEGAPA